MSKLGVGKEIVTYCSKCKLDLAHLIVAMKDTETPHKVLCNTCKSTHAYKAKKVASPSAARKKAGTRKKRVSTEDKIINIWEDAMAKLDGDPIKYNIRQKFEIGDVIGHPTFGPGLVEKNLDANKIEVVFRGTIKVLMHNK
ncbi:MULTISPECIES: hypothetical protein [Halobacteriovorax]|uniref:Uncharacterized protein n=1 Tax=Halobacteriovorax vibrionivorans TaxID=2152716 RepID=A0ABY0IGC5_9BACT|nr:MULTISPECIES: hypothetical protein [Halobacteriovorax]AYF43427.1 hypothetical protein BALOs_0415 [Halobacteriovorax sp. BALOs_7]RZF22000.1 hypothetical protein DAY19_09960 [Halobacteriovorax vibrionivorans]TGD46445.1 hypothetical protein EP118_11955 [Halobacteriovorax sp. Y22]